MSAKSAKINFFRNGLISWAKKNKRPLPWVGIKDPYRIWLSEIILQQTRVDQGLPYYEKFVARFPKIADLALAPEDEVMKLWEGLGYYTRARNMHATAKVIHEKFRGHFPDTYKDILALKGIGPYTASAIASFAYGLPHAVVDGNVFRVLSRFFAIKKPVDISAHKKEFTALAQQLLDEKSPGQYNQAIMDFGATQCVPKNPKCNTCVLQKHCKAFELAIVDQLPLKSKRIIKKQRFFNYLILRQGIYTYLCKRTGKDIWRNLYEFPLFESDAIVETFQEIKNTPYWRELIGKKTLPVKKNRKTYKQTLTHQKITANFWEISVPEGFTPNTARCFKHEIKNLSKFAFPKVIDWYLQDNSLFL